VRITLITGGAPHYEAGLIAGLIEHNIIVDVIGGDDLVNTPVLRHPQVCFRNFYGKSQQGTALWRKVLRLITVYLKLFAHAARSDARLIHIQWPYKLVFFDRTVLNLYYKALRKKIVFTAHNVDAAARDGKQSWANRVSLRFHYQIMDHIIVHTERMKAELMSVYNVNASKVSVIPHGIMSAVPESALERSDARRQLGLSPGDRVLLAFGLISPYKGLEYLVSAMSRIKRAGANCKLLIAGRVKECSAYWQTVCSLIKQEGLEADVISETRHIPDEQIEVYFKAADVLVMPYRNIFQSGVLFLSYRFGLPVIATDVGSFKEDVIQGKTGFVCRVDDPVDLAKTINLYFASELFENLERKRHEIRDYANEQYSWDRIGKMTRAVYEQVLQPC
jgi:D-inositol-3-phosphate glycosyltransferase